MGQEIDSIRFTEEDFRRFASALSDETARLQERLSQPDVLDNSRYSVGFELEACLLDQETLRPAPDNADFLSRFNNPELASMELASFNVEFNTSVFSFGSHLLADLHRELGSTWATAQACAGQQGNELLLCGILPTLSNSDLCLDNISEMKRYAALNRQIINSRHGRALQLEIQGKDHLKLLHNDVMLEAAATSYQIHFKTPLRVAKSAYNASIMLSAPILAACTNSPVLFNKNLWEETRIPLFEQAVSTGHPSPRVSFGTGYVNDSMMECFTENLQRYPVLLPMQFSEPAEEFPHLRLHNGTIWRWNRPLIGFNADGTPHVRIEFRCLPSGPSLVDTVANTALYFGLCHYHAGQDQAWLPFKQARENFYQAAKFGLEAELTWLDGNSRPASQLLLETLMPEAEAGLEQLGIVDSDIQHYLGIIRRRIITGQTGSGWQQNYLKQHASDMVQMTHDYARNQAQDLPVHEWDI